MVSCTLARSEKTILNNVLKFAITSKQTTILKIKRNSEVVHVKHPDEFRWKVRAGKWKQPEQILSLCEKEAVRKLTRDRSITILPAAKRNATFSFYIIEYSKKIKDAM